MPVGRLSTAANIISAGIHNLFIQPAGAAPSVKTRLERQWQKVKIGHFIFMFRESKTFVKVATHCRMTQYDTGNRPMTLTLLSYLTSTPARSALHDKYEAAHVKSSLGGRLKASWIIGWPCDAREDNKNVYHVAPPISSSATAAPPRGKLTPPARDKGSTPQ